jgi:hypothetical protein
MWGFLLGALAAVVVGVITDVVTGAVSRSLRRLRVMVTYRQRASSNVGEDGLFMLGEWSPARPLTPARLVTRYVSAPERPTQAWVTESVLADEVATCPDSGDVSYVTGFALDHRESSDTQHCRVTLAESDYREVRALEQLRVTRPAVLAAADQALEDNAYRYLARPLPSTVAANLIVYVAGVGLLCARRSAAVHNATNMWTVGVFETMKRADPNTPGHSEDFYGLIERGLEEELHLRHGDYGQLYVTWFGIYRPIFRGHLVAVTGTVLSGDEVIDRARQSSSSYEHDSFDWLPLHRKTVRKFATAPLQSKHGTAGQVLTVDGREYLEQSRLAVLEAWRFRTLLDI